MNATPEDIARAAALLRAGELVALPTETVYGLGADASNAQAVAKIFAAKGRPADHPLIVHLADAESITYWARDIPTEAIALARAFWPGPLTLILKKEEDVLDDVTGGQDTVGLRVPDHPIALALLRAFSSGDGGIAAPSANRFGRISPTTAQHVADDLGDAVSMILDGGACQVGIESTILDLSRLATHGPVLLRPGHISPEAIAAVIDMVPAAPDEAAPRASGTLESHYAPHTPVAMQEKPLLLETLSQLRAVGRKVALIHYSELPLGFSNARLPNAPDGFAYSLYASLRAMDLVGADVILVEAPPQDGPWAGVNDRLRRAAHGSGGIVHGLLNHDTPA
jgi:L-threonylcarbamoyladenylate synthase